MTKKSLRTMILEKRGIGLAPRTRRPISIDEIKWPYHKTTLMELLEIKHKLPIHKLLLDGSIYAVGKKLGIDPSTVSKWRTQIEKQLEVRGDVS